MSESVARRLRHLDYITPLMLTAGPNREWADSTGKRTDLKIWTVAVDPTPCAHPVHIRRTGPENGVKGSAFRCASLRSANYDPHECQALKRKTDIPSTSSCPELGYRGQLSDSFGTPSPSLSSSHSSPGNRLTKSNTNYNYRLTITIWDHIGLSSVESQKGISTIQWCSRTVQSPKTLYRDC